MVTQKKQSSCIMEETTSAIVSSLNNLFLAVAVEEEQLDHSRRMNAGIVANVAIGLMSVELVEAVAEIEATRETVEVDLQEETDSKEGAVLDALEVDQEMMEEGPES